MTTITEFKIVAVHYGVKPVPLEPIKQVAIKYGQDWIKRLDFGSKEDRHV